MPYGNTMQGLGKAARRAAGKRQLANAIGSNSTRRGRTRTAKRFAFGTKSAIGAGRSFGVRRGWDNGRKSHKMGPGHVQGVATRRVSPAHIVKRSATKIARSDGKYGSHAVLRHWDNGRN